MSKNKRSKKKTNKNVMAGMTAIVIFIVVVIAIWSVFFTNNWVTFDEEVPAEYRREIVESLQEWDEAIGCDRDISIGVLLPQSETLADGSTAITEAQADPGRIDIDFENLTDDRPIKDLIYHEATHACKPEPLVFDQPLQFSEGWIIGYQGLMIKVRLFSGRETFFTKCEEGVAERTASFLSPGYLVNSPGYYNLGAYMRELFPKGSGAENLVKNNDVPGLAAKMLGVPREQIGVEELEQMIDICQNLFESPAPE